MSFLITTEVSHVSEAICNYLSVNHFNPSSTCNTKHDLNILFSRINIRFTSVIFSETWGSGITGPFSSTGNALFFVNGWGRRFGGASLFSKPVLMSLVVRNRTKLGRPYMEGIGFQTEAILVSSKTGFR